METGDKLLKLDDAADILKISVQTLKKLIEKGDIEAIIVSPSDSKNKRFRISEKEIEKYIKEIGVYDPTGT